MDSMKNTCEICSRLYKPVSPEYPTFIPGTSSVRITLRNQDKTGFLDYKICPHCASELIWHIKTMKRNAPKKCDFCEFDHGPAYEDPQPECKDCVKHSNFQKKKRMSKIEKYKWRFYNGDIDKTPKGDNHIEPIDNIHVNSEIIKGE